MNFNYSITKQVQKNLNVEKELFIVRIKTLNTFENIFFVVHLLLSYCCCSRPSRGGSITETLLGLDNLNCQTGVYRTTNAPHT